MAEPQTYVFSDHRFDVAPDPAGTAGNFVVTVDDGTLFKASVTRLLPPEAADIAERSGMAGVVVTPMQGPGEARVTNPWIKRGFASVEEEVAAAVSAYRIKNC